MFTPAPLYFYDMKNNEMVIPALRYRKFKFIKFTFTPDHSEFRTKN